MRAMPRRRSWFGSNQPNHHPVQVTSQVRLRADVLVFYRHRLPAEAISGERRRSPRVATRECTREPRVQILGLVNTLQSAFFPNFWTRKSMNTRVLAAR